MDKNIIAFGQQLKDVISETRKYKTEHAQSMKTEMEELTIKTETIYEELFQTTIKDLKACCHAKAVTIQIG